LTIEATEDTVQRCCQGDYVYLLVPSISQVSHPFTVNRVLEQKQRLRIIFRVIVIVIVAPLLFHAHAQMYNISNKITIIIIIIIIIL